MDDPVEGEFCICVVRELTHCVVCFLHGGGIAVRLPCTKQAARLRTALLRVAGAALLDMREEWVAARRLHSSETSMATMDPERVDDDALGAELESSG